LLSERFEHVVSGNGGGIAAASRASSDSMAAIAGTEGIHKANAPVTASASASLFISLLFFSCFF
jgi:hypothetical protein